MSCLSLVIITYLLFADLRNLAGKNILSLSISLFLVQFSWLLPYRVFSHAMCHVMAGLKHYLFIVSFVAMAIIASDSYFVFAGKTVRREQSKNKKNKKFLRYVALTWGLPFVFVITCFVVDQTEIYAIYVNETKRCWFDNADAQKYLFVLPVGVLLLFNIVFFSLTVFLIQRIRSGTAMVRDVGKDHHAMFWIYLKLSTLMGFCWLFGFVFLLSGVDAFSYLFVVFASLQGAYIALAFVAKKAIWLKYKKLLGRESEPAGTSSGALRQTLMLSKETQL